MVKVLPRSDIDIFTDDVLTDPYPYYAELRNMGPVVHLDRYDVFAVTRYQDVRTVLRDWRTYTSTEGVGFNDVLNAITKDTVLTSDPPEHDTLRSVILERLRLTSVMEIRHQVEEKAIKTVRDLRDRGSFDAVKDLARVFTPLVVGELVGISPETLENHVDASEAVFTMFGPMNARTEAALPLIAETLASMVELSKEDLAPGSMGRALYEAAERGEIPTDYVPKLLWTYTGPGFYSTISAIENTIWLLAGDPARWAMVRANPDLVPSACNEAMRFESPVQMWARYCRAGGEIDGCEIPAGARLALGLASGNRDERHYPDPDEFRVARDPRDHLAFGHGIHVCVGAPLARLEMESLIRALVTEISSVELGEPKRHLNNTVRGFSSLPLTVH